VTAAPPGTGHALATRGLRKAYGKRVALNGLDLTVPVGVVYGFLGPNGAGKTTTMRLLTGLIRPDAGTIEMLGQPYRARDRTRLFDVGALVETPAFYPYLSGRDNLHVLAAAGAKVPATRVEEVLDTVALRDRAGDRFSTYSLGMKQRLGIAGALLNDPPLLLLDEPANGLDPAGIVAMRALLRTLTSQGKTVFVSSHILPEVQQLADVVGIIAAGRIVSEGPLDALLAASGNVRVRIPGPDVERATDVLRAFTNGAPLAPPTAAGDGVWLRVPGDSTLASQVNRTLAEAGIYASAIDTDSDLEEIFLGLTETPAAAA
jgi:ABC-2 type transport system ATP-binding protein